MNDTENRFIVAFDSHDKVRVIYIKNPWVEKCEFGERFLSHNDTFSWRDGDFLYFHCKNGDAKYLILTQIDEDIVNDVHQVELIESTYSPPPIEAADSCMQVQ